MIALGNGRATRPVLVALLLMVVLALAAPLMLRPATATANVCDSVGIGAACGNDTAVGGVVNGVGDTVGGAASAVAGVVTTGGKWAGKRADGLLKAAAVAGIGIGTWVACSKVLKVAAAAGTATAAGAGTAGTGAVAGGVAGIAASAAVCKLVKKGGTVVLQVAKKGLKSGGRLANVAKLAAGATGVATIVYGLQHATAWVLQNLLDLDRQSAPSLDAKWLGDLRSNLNAYAAVALMIAAIVALTFVAVVGRLSSVGRITSQLITVTLIIGIVGSLLLAALQFADAITAGVMQSGWGQRALGNWKDLGDGYAAASPVKDAADTAASAAGGEDGGSAPGLWIVRLLISVVMVFCGALVWLEMVVRDALLYLLIAFSGLLLAGYPFSATRQIAQRFGMTLLAVVVAKPVIVVTLLLGGAMMQTAAGELSFSDDGALLPLLQGAGLMALSAFMGWHIVSWFHVHGVGAMSSVGGRVRGMSVSTGGGGSATGSRSSAPGDSDRSPATQAAVSGLARATDARVGSASAVEALNGAGAAATLAGAGGAAASARLQAAQAREQTRPMEAAPTGALAVGAPTAGTQAASDDTTAPSRPDVTDAVGAPGASSNPRRGPAQNSVSRSAALPQSPAPVAGSATSGRGVSAAVAGGSLGTEQRAAAGAGARVPGSPSSGDAAAGAPAAARAQPAHHVTAGVPSVAETSQSVFGQPQTRSTSDAVFGRAPSDPAAAFGEHSTATRELLAAHRTDGRS